MNLINEYPCIKVYISFHSPLIMSIFHVELILGTRSCLKFMTTAQKQIILRSKAQKKKGEIPSKMPRTISFYKHFNES